MSHNVTLKVALLTRCFRSSVGATFNFKDISPAQEPKQNIEGKKPHRSPLVQRAVKIAAGCFCCIGLLIMSS